MLVSAVLLLSNRKSMKVVVKKTMYIVFGQILILLTFVKYFQTEIISCFETADADPPSLLLAPGRMGQDGKTGRRR